MSKAANRLWEVMEEFYGSAWVNKYGREPTNAWIDIIEAVNPYAVRDAIAECKKSKFHPPSLPEFNNLLLAFNKVHNQEEQKKELPKILTAEEKRRAQEIIRKAAPNSEVVKKRSVLMPDESYSDFQEALADAMRGGMKEADFRRERLRLNGWNDKDEEVFRDRIHMLGLSGKMLPKC